MDSDDVVSSNGAFLSYFFSLSSSVSIKILYHYLFLCFFLPIPKRICSRGFLELGKQAYEWSSTDAAAYADHNCEKGRKKVLTENFHLIEAH